MAHAWQHYVVGGVGNPRFLDCGDELCSNQSFETDTSGWTAMPSSTITRVVSSDTPFGDYCALIDASPDVNAYVYHLYDSPNAAGKKFVASFWVKGTTGAQASTTVSLGLKRYIGGQFFGAIGDRSSPVVVTGLPTDSWTFVMVEGECPAGVGAEYVTLCIWPFNYNTPPGSGTPSVYVDNVILREIETDLELSLTTLSMVNRFDKLVKSRHQMANGDEYEVVHGWRPACEMDYSYLSAADEVKRRQITEFDNIMFYPHNDVDWCFLARYEDDSLRSAYAPANKFLGHAGSINVVGKSVFTRKPTGVMIEAGAGVGGFGFNIFIG